MSTKSSIQIKELLEKFNKILEPKNEKEEIEHDAQILIFNFISEIEKCMEEDRMKQKTLAEKIKLSASYLTQVFRGDKPLNFITIAKIQKALDIKFETRAVRKKASKENASYMNPLLASNVVCIDTDYQNKNCSYNMPGLIAVMDSQQTNIQEKKIN